jgi:hypothetical protein
MLVYKHILFVLCNVYIHKSDIITLDSSSVLMLSFGSIDVSV